MTNKIEFEESCGNIFKDLELENADELNTKSTLAITILKTIKARNITQEEASKILGTHRTQLSRLNSGSGINSISMDLLLHWLIKLGGNIAIKVKVPPVIYKNDGRMRIATAN